MVKLAIHCMYVKAQEKNKEHVLSQQTFTFYDRLGTLRQSHINNSLPVNVSWKLLHKCSYPTKFREAFKG